MFDALRLRLRGNWNVSFFFFSFCNFKLSFHCSVERNVIFKNSARNVVFKKFFQVTLLSFWQPSLMSLLYFIASGSNFHRKNYFERKSGNAKFLSWENGTFQPYLHVWLCIQNIKGRTQHNPAESWDFGKAGFFSSGKCGKSWSATPGLWVDSLLADPTWRFPNPLPWLCSRWRLKHALGSGGRCSPQIFHNLLIPKEGLATSEELWAGRTWEWLGTKISSPWPAQGALGRRWRIPICSHQAWLALGWSLLEENL